MLFQGVSPEGSSEVVIEMTGDCPSFSFSPQKSRIRHPSPLSQKTEHHFFTYFIVLVGLKPIFSAVKEGAPSHLMRLHLMWIVEVLSMCPVALVSRRPDLHVLLSHRAQSPQLSSFAPSWCLLYPIPSCICSVGVHCTVTNYFFSTICSHFCVRGVCFWPQMADVKNNLYFTETCGW